MSDPQEDENYTDEEPEKPLKYPKQVFFIFGNEFCERFCYYGNRTILAIYLNSHLKYTEDEATMIYHTFAMFCYFFPIIGAILADSLCGKFRTILYLSIIYVIGNIVLSAASSINSRAFSMLGLFLIAVGTGGIKPCVSSFGGDQFILPQQAQSLALFFMVFYSTINAGSTISSILTPILRITPCLGDDSCYPLAFGVPAALMVTALVIFICGRPFYINKNPEGNIVIDVTKCIARGLWRKIFSKEKKKYWLDYASDKYSPQLIAETHTLLEIILLLSPAILFWGLYDQQGSRWTFQAVHMNGNMGYFTIKPDQMQVFNPILIMILIPIFHTIIYPILKKIRLVRTSFEKLFWGGIIAAVAFVISAYVEYRIQSVRAHLPETGKGQLRIYNNYNCSLRINMIDSGGSFSWTVDNFSWTIDSMGLLEEKSLSVMGQTSLTYSAAFEGNKCPSLSPITNGTLSIFEEKAVSFITTESQNTLDIVRLDDTFDDLEKSENTEPKIRIVYSIVNETIFTLHSKTQSSKDDGTLHANTYVTGTYLVEPAEDYALQVDDKDVIDNLPLDIGGVYTLLLARDTDKAVLFTLTQPNNLHMLWQLPQIFVISAAEIMFSITGLELTYTVAPQSMKSISSSVWLLTSSFGNFVVVVITAATANIPEATMLLVFAAMMVVVMLLFILLAIRFKRTMKRILPNLAHSESVWNVIGYQQEESQ